MNPDLLNLSFSGSQLKRICTFFLKLPIDRTKLQLPYHFRKCFFRRIRLRFKRKLSGQDPGDHLLIIRFFISAQDLCRLHLAGFTILPIKLIRNLPNPAGKILLGNVFLWAISISLKKAAGRAGILCSDQTIFSGLTVSSYSSLLINASSDSPP